MTAYTVDSSVPIPTGRSYGTFDYKALPLGTMAVGESFIIPRDRFGNRSYAAIASAIRQRAGRVYGIKVRTEVRRPEKHGEGPGLRCWRRS